MGTYLGAGRISAETTSRTNMRRIRGFLRLRQGIGGKTQALERTGLTSIWRSARCRKVQRTNLCFAPKTALENAEFIAMDVVCITWCDATEAILLINIELVKSP
jgi:hypothetical protein